MWVNIKTTLNKAKKELENTNIQSIEAYLKKQGYTVLYLGTEEAELELCRFDIVEYAENKKAFTFCSSAKFVFVQKAAHPETKKTLLLHELGHILLEHIGDGKSLHTDAVTAEAEADAFAYHISRYLKLKENRSFFAAWRYSLVWSAM